MVSLFTFQDGELILSSEVNANFRRIVEAIGVNSTDKVLAPPGQITLGQREAASISSLSDRKANDDGYLHLGWNARESFNRKGQLVLSRTGGFNDGAAVMRLGSKGMQIFATSRAAGSLQNMPKLIGIETNKRFFINPSLSMTNVDRQPQSIEDYRLTLVPLSKPIKMIDAPNGVTAKQSWQKDLVAVVGEAVRGGFHGVQFHVRAERTVRGNEDPKVVLYGKEVGEVLGMGFFVNEIGVTRQSGSVFFKRGAKANNTVIVSSSLPLSEFTVWVTGVWK